MAVLYKTCKENSWFQWSSVEIQAGTWVIKSSTLTATFCFSGMAKKKKHKLYIPISFDQGKYSCPKLSVKSGYFCIQGSIWVLREPGKGVQFWRLISPVKLGSQIWCCSESVTVFRINLRTLCYFQHFLFIQGFWNEPSFSVNQLDFTRQK